jgi:hypothetical protein
MRTLPSSCVLLVVLAALLLPAGCSGAGGTPEIKKPGVFIETAGFLVEIKQLGTLANAYGPRLFPELPEYNIPLVDQVSPIYFNVSDLANAQFKGIEWHGYRLGGNASPGSPSTAKPEEWKSIEVVKEPTTTPGIFKVVVKAADAKGRWKPEASHEYFGVAVDGGYKGGPIWAVKIK